ncbi:transglutaminaseTgpA domain-containing protein [Undibacterium sp. Di24W]|uniref:transglutaminase family protein n=1 Tax=Undibacterium sp. Di24W TaxID=3413033 RepID=UPI003BF3CF76
MGREKVDTLLLVFACLLVVANHLGSNASWISASAIGLMIWRAWLTLNGRQLPARWLLLAIASLLMGAIYWQFRSFVGRETGVAMLTLLLACKMLEMHAKRDLFVVVFLGLFLLLTSFLDSQSLGSAFQVLVSAFSLLLAQLSFQFSEKAPSLWVRCRLILKMLLLAAPLTVLCFYLFPRIQGPLWSLPSDANIARSGLSDSMTPGNLSKLAMSEELVFRVKFLEETPAKSAMYWRAIILSQFDGRSWTQIAQAVPQGAIKLEVKGKPLAQEITLEPSNNQYLFGLDSVSKTPELESMASHLNALGEIRSELPISKRLRYQVFSQTSYRLNADFDAQQIQINLRLPPGFNPETMKFAQQLRQTFPDPASRINAVLRYFREEKFYYTLEPPPLGRQSVDEFLFSSRAGFCEHYSGAFVVLMRAMGIPARVVTGYQGGLRNTQDGYYEIKQSDAHAWAEVWVEQAGWLRVDPTAAVAPDRILRNLDATQKNTGIAGIVNKFIVQNSWTNDLRMRWSAVNNAWNQWVLNYNQSKQESLWQSLGLSSINWERTLLTVFVLGLIVLAIFAIPLLSHRTKLTIYDKLYLTFCKKMQRRGYQPAIHEAPASYALRLHEHLTTAQVTDVNKFVALYLQIKYGKPTTNLNEKIQQLKGLLKKIK